jgi:protoheme IX farnesyltransferase
MTSIQALSESLLSKIRDYWPLIKSLQTGLLILTGLAGFSSSHQQAVTWQTVAGLIGSLFFSISGSTVLNMWYDRDIDARMERTCLRPLPTMRVTPRQALLAGSVLSIIGIGWALIISPIFGGIVAAGLFFNVIVYTLWLKRRTPWSILWGGIAGGMPVLAGRTLGTGGIDTIGLLLALGVLLWIPTHIMTFSLRYEQDYKNAGIPTFPAVYGRDTTRVIIALSSLVAAMVIAIAAYSIGVSKIYLGLLGLFGSGLLFLALFSVLRPSSRLNFGLFKYASIYMLLSMIVVIFNGFY